MFCDKCGKELAPGSIFCPNCGAKQLEEEPSTEMSASSSVSPVREAPSSQPSNQQSAECTTSSKHVTDESVYRKIICNNADYYLSQFQNILYGEKNKMNWASFFLSLYHAAYRGVWREWLRAVMWPLLIAIGSGLIASATIGYYPGVAIFFVVIAICGGIWWIIANILFAKKFNRVYLEHVEKKIAQQDFTPDPSGGRVIASIFAYAAGYTMVGIIIGALSVGSLMTGSDDSTYDDMQTDIIRPTAVRVLSEILSACWLHTSCKATPTMCSSVSKTKQRWMMMSADTRWSIFRMNTAFGRSGSLAGIRSRFPSNLLQPIKIKGV